MNVRSAGLLQHGQPAKRAVPKGALRFEDIGDLRAAATTAGPGRAGLAHLVDAARAFARTASYLSVAHTEAVTDEHLRASPQPVWIKAFENQYQKEVTCLTTTPIDGYC